MSEIELLAPAKNIDCARAAIIHGADAVYIGGPSFGARAAAGNSFEDLEQLVRFAHPYHAKVFVTLNTILTDKELEEAERQIQRYYDMGIDALIVQDMGILKLNLPPIALHASTQMDNRTPEKIKFLQNVGFQRVVLARELSLQQITDIRKQSDVELEAFVHGALCVCYSGRCYMSYAACGRSANRGECAQFCRLPYTLTDTEGKVWLRDKHLLSLKDMDRSDWLLPMIQAGVTSFKIEGRLKGIAYVKNITAFYRRHLDMLLDGHPEYKAASIGKTTLFFEPDPARTFHRDKTSYFIDGKRSDMVQMETPKSTGAFVGTVRSVSHNSLIYSGETELHNGDGLCFVNIEGEFSGFRVNKVEGNRLFWKDPVSLTVGDKLYRNYDIQFEKMLDGKSADRRIAVTFTLMEQTHGFLLRAEDEAGTMVELPIITEKLPAEKAEQAFQNIENQLSKLGNTSYVAKGVNIQTTQAYFFPSSMIVAWRRQMIELLEQKSLQIKLHPKVTFPKQVLSQQPEAINVFNAKAKELYNELGMMQVEEAYEKDISGRLELMSCKYCIRHALNACLKDKNVRKLPEYLFLKTGRHVFRLSFDCVKCEMKITKLDEDR